MELHVGPSKRRRRKPSDLAWAEFWSPAELKAKEIESNKKMSLANVALPLRVINTLEQRDILTLGDLANSSYQRLEAIPNLGYLTLKKCAAIVLAHGLEAKFIRELKT